MATALDIINRAFAKLGIGVAGEAMTAEYAEQGLAELNAMLHGWKLRGVDVEHVDLALGDTFALDAEYQDPTAICLAARLALIYVIPLTFDADDAFRTVQAAYATIPDSEIPTDLTQMPSGAIWGRGALI